MFDDSLFKIIGHSCIKHCLLIIGKNVNIVLSIIVEHNPFRIDASFLGMTIIKNVKPFIPMNKLLILSKDTS